MEKSTLFRICIRVYDLARKFKFWRIGANTALHTFLFLFLKYENSTETFLRWFSPIFGYVRTAQERDSSDLLFRCYHTLDDYRRKMVVVASRHAPLLLHHVQYIQLFELFHSQFVGHLFCWESWVLGTLQVSAWRPDFVWQGHRQHR